MKLSVFSVFLLYFTSASARVTSHPDGHNGVTYNPGEECMPYDGSVVPDCDAFIHPETKWPFYHPHSSNCSRFWECGPAVETCLFECANCQHNLGENGQCSDPEGNTQWALTFNPSMQYPDGPVCIWPIDCKENVGCYCDGGATCDVNNPNSCNVGGLCGECVAPGYCDYHKCCATDADCTDGTCGVCDTSADGGFTCKYSECSATCPCNAAGKCGGECGVNGTCSYDECCTDSDCDHFDGVCNVPAPHDENYCDYCNGGNCDPGCLNNANCPDNYECNLNTHQCEAMNQCESDPDCNTDVSGICDTQNAEYTECFYCDTDKTCKPGCTNNGDSTLKPRCPATTPNCNPSTHKCSADPGHQLLNYIKVTSNSCTGCTTEGLSLILMGDDDASPTPTCETGVLDHPGIDDYVSVTEFKAIPEEIEMGWGACYEAPLDGRISSAEVTWTGSGSWSGESICFDWSDENRKVYICKPPAGTSLGKDESVVLTSAEWTCSSGPGVDCP